MKLSTWGHWSRQPLAIAGVIGVLLFAQIAATRVSAADLWRWGNPKPKTPHQPPCPPNMITLAKQVTKLEDRVRLNGSITIKQPDVWGESNLMAYIQEYEEEMKESVDKFRETIQGYRLTRDSAQLASSTSAAFGGADDKLFTSTESVAATAATQTDANSTSVPLAQLTKLVTELKPTSVGSDGKTAATPFGLEPNELERQHSVYIQMNQSLRRTNMGDDNSRAAGNSLYLLRFPVSVLPGRETYEGYSAVITLRAHLVVDDAHLRYQFPKMVVADAVNAVVPILFAYWDKPNVFLAEEQGPSQVTMLGPVKKQTSGHGQRSSVNPQTPGSIQQLVNQYGPDELTALLKFVKLQYQGERPKVEELRGFLFGQFLNLYEQLIAEGMFTPGDEGSDVVEYLVDAGAALALGDCDALIRSRNKWTHAACSLDINCDKYARNFSWILGMNAAILDENILRLLEARERAGSGSGRGGEMNPDLHFFIVDSPWQAEINKAWAQLIEDEFPVHVFALNPMIEEQNVYDAFSRSRDLQIAFAMAVANGNMRASQALRFSRQVSLEMAAIGLNRTAVAFAHGNDTFGWYFHPRVQSPPTERSNIAAFGRMLWSGGPTERYDQRHEKLDPGIRECEAVIVMPAFVSNVKFDVITNWERRSKPGAVKRDYAQMLVEGAEILSTLEYAANVGDQACFRAADYDVLVSRVEQIEKMLPLQSVNVRLPFEHEMSGSELFDGGQSQLKPRLDGYYGLEYVSGTDKAEVFLTGAHFHPVLTRVILGGREAECVEVMSRELLKVRFKYVAKPLTTNPVEVRVATPAGISGPETIPLASGKESPQTGFAWGTEMPVTGGFNPLDCASLIQSLNPAEIEIKHLGIPQGIVSSTNAELWLVPKFLRPDGSEIKANQSNAPLKFQGLSFDGSKLKLSAEDLREMLNERIHSACLPLDAGLTSFTVTADAFLAVCCGCPAVKVNGPLKIQLTATNCACPVPAPAVEPAPNPSKTSAFELPGADESDRTPMPEEIQPAELSPEPIPDPQASKNRPLRLVVGKPAPVTTLRSKVQRAHQPDSSKVRQAGAILRR